MTYDQLVTLDAVVKCGSFKAASKFLSKSQPSLSIAIKNLEEEFGFKIFSREKYRPELTKNGQAFYEKAKILINDTRELESLGRELAQGLEPEIRIVLEAISPIEPFKKVFQGFFEPHVTTTLNLQIDILEGVTEKVLNQDVDFAIGYLQYEHPELEAIKMTSSKMIPVISSALKKDNKVKVEDLKKFPQIVIRSNAKNPSKSIIGGLKGSKKWYTSDISMKEQLILNGLGWGRLPAHQIQDKIDNQQLHVIDYIDQVNTVTVPLYLIRNKNHRLGPNARRLWEYLKSTSTE